GRATAGAALRERVPLDAGLLEVDVDDLARQRRPHGWKTDVVAQRLDIACLERARELDHIVQRPDHIAEPQHNQQDHGRYRLAHAMTLRPSVNTLAIMAGHR